MPIYNYENFFNENNIRGGNSEGKTKEDIAKIHNISVEEINNILSKAIEIEMEHTNDEKIAERIALDHLVETPLYYDDKIGLPNMEKELDDIENKTTENETPKVNLKKFDKFIESISDIKTHDKN